MWGLIRLLSYSFATEATELTAANQQSATEELAYIEKIEQFALQEFDANQRLSHFVQARQYFNFEDAPALLLDPQVTTYDLTGAPDYVLSSSQANYLNSGEVKFQGRVDIRSANGMTHQMQTDELLVNSQTNDLIGHKPVTYLGTNATMHAQGMHMRTQEDTMKLTGKTRIDQDNGQKILTRDLHIDQSNNQQRYYAEHDTTYLSEHNTIDAGGIDMDAQQQILQLLGEAKITQDTGSVINTKNLIIDQSKGQELYHTKDKIHYLSEVADIKALGMDYDAQAQKIKLTGGVSGKYE